MDRWVTLRHEGIPVACVSLREFVGVSLRWSEGRQNLVLIFRQHAVEVRSLQDMSASDIDNFQYQIDQARGEDPYR